MKSTDRDTRWQKAGKVFSCWVWAALIGVAGSWTGSAAEAEQLAMSSERRLSRGEAAFGMNDVVRKARSLSKGKYQDPRGKMPGWLLEITYDQLRDIRFIPAKSHWRDENLPFELQFFHAGLYFDRTVRIHEITPDGTVPIRFSTDLFNYEKSAQEIRERVPNDLGFAGFRIHCNINTAAYKDEVAVFLGATYFRAVAKSMHYGLSARGLAVDTVQPTGEEFPWFREFWIRKPAAGDSHITVYALLDSPRLTGAYSFVIRPGSQTRMDVESTIFLRQPVETLGIAPMTSMFFYGENTNIRPRDGFRPEIHDSDGLMIHMQNGEWLWRPLSNPQGVEANSFLADNPSGFGLMQRDLDFDHYQDLEARYDYRPSLWCTPKGAWGKGRVELVQLPTDDEIHDNIVAYWRPDAAPVGEPLSFAYTLSWAYPDPNEPPAGRVVATRTEQPKDPSLRMFVIDFEGGNLGQLHSGDAVEGVVSVGPGATLAEQQVYKNVVTGGWRAVFQIRPDVDPITPVSQAAPERRSAVEMRAFLKKGDEVLTETWTYGIELWQAVAESPSAALR
ncbi:MAG: glucan biosynthesis protein G [bacterium]